MELVNVVVGVGQRCASGLGCPGLSVGSSVVGVLHGEIPRGQESVGGGGRGETAHVVVGEGVGAGRVLDLGHASGGIVGVLHGSAVRVGFSDEPVLEIVVVDDELAL